MTLRDRIAEEVIRSLPFGRERQRSAEETADAILSDPEIAALREVAELSASFKRKVATYLDVADRYGDASDIAFDMNHQAGIAGNKLDAALARLEEARRG